MEMNAEALGLIQDTANKAQSPQKIYEDDDHLMVAINGEANTIKKGALPRSHQVQSLVDLIEAAKWAKDFEASPIVWHNEAAVFLVMDDLSNGRKDLTVFGLTHSAMFKTVSELSKKAFRHKEFIRLLQVDLAGAVIGGTNLIASVRKLEAVNTSRVTSQEAHQARGFGKSVEDAILTDVPLPTELRLCVAVYSNDGERNSVMISCALEVEPSGPSFTICPLPDELTIAVQSAQRSIRKRLDEGLADSGVRVFYGRP